VSAQFSASSRYYSLPLKQLTDGNGRAVAYVSRRFLPSPAAFALLQERAVVERDRLDNIAADVFGDPEQFWRLCDANAAMFPDDLVAVVGAILRITLPEGIPGPV
jgi:hypothetical protein